LDVSASWLIPNLHDGHLTLSFSLALIDFTGRRPRVGLAPIELTPQSVSDIPEKGGTILGSSRGKQPTYSMVDFLAEQKINILLCTGGDGTLRGAQEIAKEVQTTQLILAEYLIHFADFLLVIMSALVIGKSVLVATHCLSSGVSIRPQLFNRSYSRPLSTVRSCSWCGFLKSSANTGSPVGPLAESPNMWGSISRGTGLSQSRSGSSFCF
jgi:hypothetical protein